MAKPAAPAPQAAPTAAAPAAGPTLMSLIMAMAVLTGLSVGAGGMFGLQVLSKMGRQPPPAAKTETKAGESAKGRFSEKATLHALSPIVTNLASPENTWIRLEASIVIDGESAMRRGSRPPSPKIRLPTCARCRCLSSRVRAVCCTCART